MKPISILVTLLTLVAWCVSNAPVHAADRPNVLFIICDDLNCDLGSYGHPMVKSPNIDKLAARGVRFDRAYCQYPLCGPSRASFMTGLYPDQTLIRANAIRLRERLPEVRSLTQMFRNAGYTATRIGKIYHYGVPGTIGTDGHDDPASWDATVNPRGRDKDDEAKVFTLRPGQYGGTLSWLAADGTDEQQTDGIGAAAAVATLEERAKDGKPFFLAVGFYRPHTPYVAPKRYFGMYPTDKITVPRVPQGYFDTLPTPARQGIMGRKEQFNLADDLARQAMQAYYASITFVDGQVGRVVDALDRLGLAKNTIIVFTSDHGYHMGEHGHWQKTTLFENAARVPLIVAVPGMAAAGKTTESLAEMTDFYPTLAELCGLTPPANLPGVSLAPILKDPAATPRSSALTQWAGGYSIRTARYRYTEWGPEGRGGNELYDHVADPHEMRNLAHEPDEKAKAVIDELSPLLRQRIADARRAPPGLKQIDPGDNPRNR